MLKNITKDLNNLKPKIIENSDIELKDLYEPLSKVETNIRSIDKNSKKSIMSIEFLKEEINSKNNQIFLLKNELEQKQYDEVKIYKKILLILDQIDNIYKFANQIENQELVDSLNIVLKIVRKEIVEIGLEEVKSMGELFNPSIHKCITKVDDSTKQSNEIVSVIEAGYKLNGNVLRPASVIITK